MPGCSTSVIAWPFSTSAYVQPWNPIDAAFSSAATAAVAAGPNSASGATSGVTIVICRRVCASEAMRAVMSASS